MKKKAKVLFVAPGIMKIDVSSHWYKNCKMARSKKYKICDECQIREAIEYAEVNEKYYDPNERDSSWDCFG